MDQNIINSVPTPECGQKKKSTRASGIGDVFVGVGDVFVGVAAGVGRVGDVAVKGTMAVGKGVVDCVGAVAECVGDIAGGC